MVNQVVGKYDRRPSGGSPECGFTDPNATPQPLPDKLVWPCATFQHTESCEAWCDDVLVIPYTPNCKSWEAQGNKMTYDRAKCVGKKMLSFYWAATHTLDFQVYPSCVRIARGARSMDELEGDDDSENAHMYNGTALDLTSLQ